jgi:hypothetical protein
LDPGRAGLENCALPSLRGRRASPGRPRAMGRHLGHLRDADRLPDSPLKSRVSCSGAVSGAELPRVDRQGRQSRRAGRRRCAGPEQRATTWGRRRCSGPPGAWLSVPYPQGPGSPGPAITLQSVGQPRAGTRSPGSHGQPSAGLTRPRAVQVQVGPTAGSAPDLLRAGGRPPDPDSLRAIVLCWHACATPAPVRGPARSLH